MIWLVAGPESKAVDVKLTAALLSVGKAKIAAIAHKYEQKKRTGLSSTDVIVGMC
jgi:hypothetical protein